MKDSNWKYDWNTRDVLKRLDAAAGAAVDKSAKAGAQTVRNNAPGSISSNVEITKKQRGTEKTAVVSIKSRERAGAGDRVPYHSVFPEWGTAKQPGQHFGLKGLKVARTTLDREADGLL